MRGICFVLKNKLWGICGLYVEEDSIYIYKTSYSAAVCPLVEAADNWEFQLQAAISE